MIQGRKADLIIMDDIHSEDVFDLSAWKSAFEAFTIPQREVPQWEKDFDEWSSSPLKFTEEGLRYWLGEKGHDPDMVVFLLYSSGKIAKGEDGDLKVKRRVFVGLDKAYSDFVAQRDHGRQNPEWMRQTLRLETDG